MPALNFQKQFVDPIKCGDKSQTIRSTRKNPIKKGDTLYLYTGMRTKSCEKIGVVLCKDVLNFKIQGDGLGCEIEQTPVYYMDHLNRIATEDGFEDWIEMVHWFVDTHGLPFKGNIIYW